MVGMRGRRIKVLCGVVRLHCCVGCLLLCFSNLYFFGLFDLDDESCSFRVIFSIGGFSCHEIFSYNIDYNFFSCGINRNKCC